jgi:hypothetical protein
VAQLGSSRTVAAQPPHASGLTVTGGGSASRRVPSNPLPVMGVVFASAPGAGEGQGARCDSEDRDRTGTLSRGARST